jgi:phosphatidylserine/phosphatidylglycerophosphate/cardiolipin synthase-like enzyme
MTHASLQSQADDAGRAAALARPRAPVLIPGRNCWTKAQAERASVLVDAAQYFRALDQAFARARRSIYIVGWDFDASIILRPDGPAHDRSELGPLLRSLVEARPDLEVRILVWNLSFVHAPGAALPLLVGASWEDHPRLTLKLDTEHPVYGSQHQKIVCVDDRIAFVGGIDLTVCRWDSRRHDPADPLRRNSDGSCYGPVHDVQMAVEGKAAEHIADLVRERWRIVTGEVLQPCADGCDPNDLVLPRDFRRTQVAISRTSPAWKNLPHRREGADLTADLLRAARDFIYIEAQYLTAPFVGALLKRLLMQRDGPEIVVVLRAEADGFFERRFMSENRDRLLRRLKKIDRFDRLRVYSPVVHTTPEPCHILVHSKVMIVDDLILRIGSSNLNNRSIGLDTECDLAIEAEHDEMRRSIRDVRLRLIAEHLGCTPDDVAQAHETRSSLIGAIESLNGGVRSMEPFAAMHRKGPTRQVWGTALFDPERPFRWLSPLMRILRRWGEPRPRRRQA